METAYDGRQVVGMDLHRRSVLVRMTEDGRRLGTAKITNSPQELRKVIARAGKSPRVVLEATYGWYWAADVLEAAGEQVHGVLAKLGVTVTCTDIFGRAGSAWLDGLRIPQPYAGKVTSLRHLAGELTTEITMLSEVIASLLAGDRGYHVIQQLPGIGPVLAAVIIAEIGDVTRFSNAGQLCSPSGLTPRHRESDTKVARGHVTKQGSRLLRWALIEAIQRIPKDSVIGGAKDAIIARRGKEAKNIAKVAAARKLLTLVFYGLRDGQIRCLSQPREDPPATQTARAA